MYYVLDLKAKPRQGKLGADKSHTAKARVASIAEGMIGTSAEAA